MSKKGILIMLAVLEIEQKKIKVCHSFFDLEINYLCPISYRYQTTLVQIHLVKPPSPACRINKRKPLPHDLPLQSPKVLSHLPHPPHRQSLKWIHSLDLAQIHLVEQIHSVALITRQLQQILPQILLQTLQTSALGRY